MHEFRCLICRQLLGRYNTRGIVEIKCPRCKALNTLVIDDSVVQRVVLRSVADVTASRQ